MPPADEALEFGAAEEAGYELLLGHPGGATAAELARDWIRALSTPAVWRWDVTSNDSNLG